MPDSGFASAFAGKRFDSVLSWYLVAKQETQEFMASRMKADIQRMDVDHTAIFTAPDGRRAHSDGPDCYLRLAPARAFHDRAACRQSEDLLEFEAGHILLQEIERYGKQDDIFYQEGNVTRHRRESAS